MNNLQTNWFCEKWSEDAVKYTRTQLESQGIASILGGYDYVPTGRVNRALSALINHPVVLLKKVPRFINVSDGITSDMLRHFVGLPDLGATEISGNLLLNEGIQRLEDLLIGAGGTVFDNTNAFLGVGDTNTAAAASQTELQATNNAANRFYKAMNATYPSRSSQTVSWQSDFTSGEANFAWNEWTVAAGSSSSSGSGFLVGTTNLNRKVASLGTKSGGTWTFTGQITIS